MSITIKFPFQFYKLYLRTSTWRCECYGRLWNAIFNYPYMQHYLHSLMSRNHVTCGCVREMPRGWFTLCQINTTYNLQWWCKTRDGRLWTWEDNHATTSCQRNNTYRLRLWEKRSQRMWQVCDCVRRQETTFSIIKMQHYVVLTSFKVKESTAKVTGGYYMQSLLHHNCWFKLLNATGVRTTFDVALIQLQRWTSEKTFHNNRRNEKSCQWNLHTSLLWWCDGIARVTGGWREKSTPNQPPI
jgi:hypothetical protein